METGRGFGVVRLAACLAAAALAGGCQTPSPAPPRANVQFDACAERLHDLCGDLLLYYSTHAKLPPALKDLSAGGSPSTSQIVCPVSGRPYVYKAAGRSLPGRQGRLVLYDPEPSHSGMRWGILVRTPASGGLMTANVILVSESDLASARKRP